MRKETREQFKHYLNDIASLNGIEVGDVVSKFNVEPSVQQKLETRVQESSEFLGKINLYPVQEQSGDTVGLGVSGPIAGTQNTDEGERETRDVAQLDQDGYRCEQINYDTHIKYKMLDAWAKFPDFAPRLSGAIIQRIALDRIMMGFNGVKRARTSNRVQYPLLQDVAVGWLQKIRERAPGRYLKEGKKEAGKMKIGKGGDFNNLDAMVFAAVNELIDPWHQNDTQLVAISGRRLMSDKLFPLVNGNYDPMNQKAAQDLIVSQRRIGNLQAVQVPYFPPNSMLITRLDNLSVYWQEGTNRRSVMDNPKRDRIETFQSSNDDFVIEDFGCCAFIENIELIPESAA